MLRTKQVVERRNLSFQALSRINSIEEDADVANQELLRPEKLDERDTVTSNLGQLMATYGNLRQLTVTYDN